VGRNSTGQHQHCLGGQGEVEDALRHVRRRHWLAVELLQGRFSDTSWHHHPQGNRPLSFAEGDRAEVFLPGLGHHVQARGGSPLRVGARLDQSPSCSSLCAR